MTSVGDVRSKLAVTDLSAVIVTVQVPVPEQPPPLQPAKVEPEAAVAVSVTTVLLFRDAAIQSAVGRSRARRLKRTTMI